MQVVVVGTGYVGLVAGTCFANLGFYVTCLDNNINKIDNLKQGKMPIYEPGLEELVMRNYQEGRLHFATDKRLLEEANIVIIAVGTPANHTGSANLSYLDEVLDDISTYAKNNQFIVIKSTVPIGTASRVKNILHNRRGELTFNIISNPEFLREGSAVNDFLHPDRIVIGAENPESKEVARKLYSPLIANGAHIEFTDNTSAEIIKYAANAFLAMKVAFINEVSDLSEHFGGDIEEIANGIGSDKRIGRYFLNPGPGYGGSCFPKDTSALAQAFIESKTSGDLITSVIKSNNSRKQRMAERIISYLDGNPMGKIMGILGLTFKAETDDMRDSASINIINTLKEYGVIIQAYDPKGMEEAKMTFGDSIIYCKDSYHAAKNADILCVITEWAEFKTLELNRVKTLMKAPKIIDLRNIYSCVEMRKLGFDYISLGRKKILNNGTLSISD